MARFLLRPRRTSTTALVALGLGAVGLTACGSTVPLSRTVAGNATSAFGSSSGTTLLPGNGATGADSTGVAGANSGTPAAGSSGESGSSSPSAGDSTTGGSSHGFGTSAAVTQSTKAITGAAPIRVGIPYLNSSETNAFTSSVGSGLSTNDPSQLYTAYIDRLNSGGGILGHKVVPVYYSISPYENTTQIAQAACNYFTQDDKVSFVMSGPLDQFYSCLNSRGVAVLNDAAGDETAEAELAAEPLALLPESIGLDRLARIDAVQLDQMGFFGNAVTDKLGVLYFDNDQDSVDGYNALKAALAAEHVPIAESESISEAADTSGVGAMEAQVSSAELKFKAEGVNEVTCEETTPWICAFFALYASNQDYYPRYAFSSAESLTAIVANVPAKELANSVFVGWYPAEDLQSVNEMPAVLQACLNFFEKDGISITTGNARAQAEGVCSDVNLFAAALEVAPSISAVGLIEGAERLGSTFHPVGSFGAAISSGQRDGVSVIRRGDFVTSCDCYQYTSGDISVP